MYRDTTLEITRDEHGVPHIRAEHDADLCRGLGYAHGTDRALSLVLMRTLGQGRLAETLDPSDTGVAIDRFFRRMGWTRGAAAAVAELTPQTRALCEAYAAGVNQAFAVRRPWELRLVGHRPEPWTVADSVLILRMTGYLTLSQSQAEGERLLVELVQAGVSRARLDELFPGLLAELDEDLVRRVQLDERLVPSALWDLGAPRLTASNNWIVAARHSASGKPLLANDPHLEVNRLPNVWYEVVWETPTRWAWSATMPGLPGLVVGRTSDLAWGATYAFMDSVDSWIEDVRGDTVRRAQGAAPLTTWRETINRKGKSPVEITLRESDLGVVEGEGDGLWLASRWSASRAGARSLEAMAAMWRITNLADAMATIGRVELPFNWVLADGAGATGYQMSGLMPLRRAGTLGFVPLAGWQQGVAWQGFAAPEQLPRVVEPAAGFFVTANDDLNCFGALAPITLPMGDWRAKRIAELLAQKLAAKPALDLDDLAAIQLDVHSLQAAAFMPLLRPLLPMDSDAARELADWDLAYDVDSLGAARFEAFYRALRRAVLAPALGARAAAHLDDETGLWIDFYQQVDRVLVAERSAWFGDATRDDLWRAALAEALAQPSRRWGDVNRLTMRHLILGDRLPRWMGFDRGPIELPGGRATVRQGQIYRSAGRVTSFAPALRFVTDLGVRAVESVIAGGPSDRRFSPWYVSDLGRWQGGTRKLVGPTR